MHAKAQSLVNEALLHQQAGRLDRASTLYATVRRSFPQCFEAWCFAGAAALQLNRHKEAATLLKQALVLNPRSAMANLFLGTVEMQLGATLEAEKHLQLAANLSPKDPNVWWQLGQGLLLNGDAEKTSQAFLRCLELNPKHADAWTGLGCVRLLQGRAAESAEHHSRSLSLNPNHPSAQFGRAQAYMACGRLGEAQADFAAHLARNPNDLDAASQRLLLLNYLPGLSREQLLAEHLAWANSFKQKLGPSKVFQAGDPEKKLRVAFLSPDLRTHSVAFFLEPLLAALDRSQFEIILYHNHPTVDATSQRLRALAALWRNLVGQTEDAAAATIYADAPDVLFDLTGHTGYNRTALFARRLAPVQIAYLGYPNTTGLQAMDYRFTDSIADPEGESEPFYTEKLIRFSTTAWSYASPPTAPEIGPPPVEKSGRITFGCFNNVCKLSPGTLKLWARLLDELPDARLLVKSIGLSREVFLKLLEKPGLNPARVELLSAAPTTAEHLGCYARIDIALDPFPYHGTTTTCEALWMGVPVITLAGDRHASRVGVSLLNAVGHSELVAKNDNDYVAIAKALASDTARLGRLRTSLRSEMLSSPLMRHDEQAANFGRAIRACWRNFCEGHK
jgi:predicted O-linked N-acetylglucosamine transferase (SPINDLY family)